MCQRGYSETYKTTPHWSPVPAFLGSLALLAGIVRACAVTVSVDGAVCFVVVSNDGG